jgi:glycosyltransferase involved in cell wall biosynthesis
VKILLVHNFYGSTAPSGENTAYSAEAALLRHRGHSVDEFTRHSDEVLHDGFAGTLRSAASVVWNPFSLRLLKRTLRETKPDIVHVHNTFPLLSPSVFYASRERNIPTVMTLHNYRMGCAAGTALRNDQPCTLCLDNKSVIPALRYGCYRESRIATLPVAAMIAYNNARDTWRSNVDAFITLTDFQKEKMIRFGLLQESLFVKPHFLDDPPQPVPWTNRENKIVFVGRLYAAKGIHILLDAWRRMGKRAPHLEVIGDGPMREELVHSVRESEAPGSVSFLGNVSHDEAMKRMSSAKLLVVPSVCYEGFPMVVQESFALGVPVAASNIGSLPYLITEDKNGRLFVPGDPVDIITCVTRLLADDARLRFLAEGARRDFDEKYTAEKNYSALMAIYEAAAERRAAKVH